jgi:hypothetical protein
MLDCNIAPYVWESLHKEDSPERRWMSFVPAIFIEANEWSSHTLSGIVYLESNWWIFDLDFFEGVICQREIHVVIIEDNKTDS